MKKCLTLLVWIMYFATSASAQCTADFSYSVNNLFDYKFINISSPYGDSGTTFQWNFGNGDTTITANTISHSFDSLGTYVVCMTMKDPIAKCSSSYCDTVVISCPAMAGYTYTIGTDYVYDFNYTSSSNDQVTWLWNFGDGTTATTRTVSHTFPHTGVYDVCLTVTDVATKCTNTYCSDISVCVATARYTYSNSSPLNYSFTDGSSGEDASTTFLWDFGDGDTSAAQDPSYTFPGPGTYDVCLTIDVHDSGCTNKYCLSISVACADSSNFSYVNTGGLTFQFTDLSTGEDTSVTYSWSFGDGTASPEKNAQHTFTSPGTHDVCLTIRNVDQGCTSTFCSTVKIACNDSAGFTYSNHGNIYQFSDASVGEDTSATFEWTFGDGDSSTVKNPIHTYSGLGAYQVCLRMTDADVSCSSQFCENISVTCPLSASFTYSATDSAISFQDATTGEDSSATFKWTFGDNDSSSAQDPLHVYAISGSYHVCLTVENIDLGCSNQYCQDILVNVSGCKDTAGFTYTNVVDSFNFQNASKNIGDSATYKWTFGDGDTSVLTNPSHAYTSFGAFQVCLVITDFTNSCSSEYCENINVINGINQVSANKSIRIYPNPATGLVNIDLRGFGARSILIFDQLGQRIKQVIPNDNGVTSMDISDLPAGIYLVSARSDNKMFSAALIITGK